MYPLQRRQESVVSAVGQPSQAKEVLFQKNPSEHPQAVLLAGTTFKSTLSFPTQEMQVSVR
jgi:hypothetical protein